MNGEAVGAVRRLLVAARRVVSRRADLAADLVATTGLSPEGVELALTEHLEVDATDADLARLVAAAEGARAARVGVVLSANVFVGALRAIAFARACAPIVHVRPSRRDPTFTRALVEALNEGGDASVVLDEDMDPSTFEAGELHVYGRDETISTLKARTRVPVRGHGSGMGVALVGAAADLASAAAALAEDVVPFDQRGCLSPRITVVVGGESRARTFAGHLHHALGRLGAAVPRGTATAEERAEATRYIATVSCAGECLVSAHHAIGVAEVGAPLLVPPAYRHIHVAPVAGETSRSDRDAVAELLRPLAPALTAIGADDVEDALALARSLGISVRASALGAMQRPPLDGPVDLRPR